MKAYARVFFGVGLLLILSAPVSYAISGPLVAGIKAAFGVLFVGLWFFTRDRSATLSGKAAFYYWSSAVMIVAAAVLLTGINFVVAKRGKTWDLTSKKIYSLAPQTQAALKDLKAPIKAIAFLPSKHEAYDDVERLLKRYAAESDQFTYEFKDPLKDPRSAERFQLKEGNTTVILLREGKDGRDSTHTALNVLDQQELTNALIKLDTVGQQKLFFTVGHGEYSLDDPPPGADASVVATGANELRSNLVQEGYAPSTLNLVETPEIPKDASALVIAGARTKFTDQERKLLEAYLAEGGRLVYFAEPLADTGLEPLLEQYGVRVEMGVLADKKLNPDNPYSLIAPGMADHEITRFLKAQRMFVQFAMARALTLLREGMLPGVTVTPVVVTSQYAWVETEPNEEPKLDSGERTGAMPVVAASVRDTKGAPNKRFDEARVLVFGNGIILVNGNWGSLEANRNLVLNGIAWAAAQSQKITIRPPDRDITTFQLSPEAMTNIQLASVDLLPILLIATGLVIWLSRRNQ
jgi:ABC-type uncharacterized transport system involved in gliding motility auxiliary subunit